ncbi:MAG: response regulator [Nevskia sp.]|nr:response regulator [Nevskia sp.]
MILTDRADAGAAIDLINRGQVYRFITKPIHGNQTKIAVTSALRQHQRLAQSPELHQRYEVERAPESASTAASPRLFDRIRALRSWVTRRG